MRRASSDTQPLLHGVQNANRFFSTPQIEEQLGVSSGHPYRISPRDTGSVDDGTPPQPIPNKIYTGGLPDDIYLGIPEQMPIIRIGAATPLSQRLGFPDRRSSGLSPIRRLFCYVVAFDLISNFIAWIVYLAMQKGYLVDNMIKEITDYTIQTSLFDCIGFAVFRFIVLEIVYAGLQLRHWWPALLTMILSTVFMVAKCFVSLNTPDEIKPDEPTFAKYAVILAGIIASWVEVCFLDFKVIPTEKFSDAYFEGSLGGGGTGIGNNATSPINGLPAGKRSGQTTKGFFGGSSGDLSTASSRGSNDDNFHTPVESEEEEEEDEYDGAGARASATPLSIGGASSSADIGDSSLSSNEDGASTRRSRNKRSVLPGRKERKGSTFTSSEGADRSLYHSASGLRSHLRSPSTISSVSLAPHEIEWISQARDTMKELVQLFAEEAEWTPSRSGGEIKVGGFSDVVLHYSRNHPKYGKIFKCRAELRAPLDVATQELLQADVADLVDWNSNLAEARKVQQLDDVTAVAYSVTPQLGGGIISPRDYVDLQYWKKTGNSYYSCSKGIVHPEVPPVSKFVRGCNGAGGFRMSRGQSFNITVFEWIINTSIGGWIPQRVVDAAIAGIQDDFVRDYRNHLTAIQSYNSV